MEPRYAYNYAQIDLETGECVNVRSRTAEINNPALIPIPVYDPEYIGKFYINGAWYADAAGTIPWQSGML